MSSLAQQRTWPRHVAMLVTSVFAPAHLVIALLLTVGAASHPSALRGLGWGALAALLVAAIPYAWVMFSVRRGWLGSRHIPDRRERLRPFTVAGVFAVVGLALLDLLGGPPDLLALVVAMVVGLAAVGIITTQWKISLHTAVAGGTVAILAIVFGTAMWGAVALVLVTGWSRITMRHHTVSQVIAGGLLGSLIATATFVVLT